MEPLMKCRNVRNDGQNRGDIAAAGRVPTLPVYGRSGIRHERWSELAMRRMSGVKAGITGMLLRMKESYRKGSSESILASNLAAGMCANLSWKLKRLQTLWFDGIGRNNIKPVRERSRDEGFWCR